MKNCCAIKIQVKQQEINVIVEKRDLKKFSMNENICLCQEREWNRTKQWNSVTNMQRTIRH